MDPGATNDVAYQAIVDGYSPKTRDHKTPKAGYRLQWAIPAFEPRNARRALERGRLKMNREPVTRFDARADLLGLADFELDVFLEILVVLHGESFSWRIGGFSTGVVHRACRTGMPPRARLSH